MQNVSIKLGFWLILLILGGCATQRDFYDQAVKTNIAVEEAHNRILLLNVLRAYKHQPMHFTGFSKINGPAGSASPSFGFAIPFGPDFTNNVYQFLPTIRPDTASYEIGIYDKQEFIRGFMTPMTLKLFQYFLDQGWPKALLLHLAVRRIDLVENGKTEILLNEPQDRVNFVNFQAWVHKAANCDVQLGSSDPKQTILDLSMKKEDLPNGQALLAMLEKGFSFKERTDPNTKAVTYELHKSGAEPVLKFESFSGSLKKCPISRAFAPSGQDLDKNTPIKSATDGSKIYLRSAEAMVYYLGELIRAQLDATYEDRERRDPWKEITVNIVYKKDGTGVPERLFYLARGQVVHEDDLLLAVQYDGVTYGIPRNDDLSGRSRHVLSLVTQLIGLQKSATDLPSTTTVRIIQ